MYIYKTTNILNGKIYIGLSKYNPDENPKYLGSGYILRKAIKCYGEEFFDKEILETCDTKEKLCERERYWIQTLKSNYRDIGYNICEGGEWGDTWTHNPNKEAIREKYRNRVGNKNPNYGKRWTTEQKKAASEMCIKRKAWIDKKTGINIASLPENRKKISESKMGINNPNACIWRLISPIGDEFIIEGGIKREIKKYGLSYQQFRITHKIEPMRQNIKGWKLIKIHKNTMPL